MPLTNSQVQSVFTSYQDKTKTVLSKLPEPDTLENCEYIDKVLSLIYKSILDSDPYAIIFNISFSMCLEDTSTESTARNIAEFKRILPIYLTYKDVGFANLSSLKDIDLFDSNDLLVFKFLGKIRTSLVFGDSINEDMSNTIFCALFLYILNLEKQQQDADHLKSIAQYTSQLCSLYLHPEGISLLLARREGIACSIDPGYQLRETAEQLLSESSITDCLPEDQVIAQSVESIILDNIAEEEARAKRIEERKQQLREHTAATLNDMRTQAANLQSSVASQLEQNKASIKNQSAANVTRIERFHENMLHDISHSNGGGMFSMPGVNAPMPSASLGVGFKFDSNGPDLVGTHTHQTVHGPQTTNFSLREAQIANMQETIQRTQQINTWWNNQVTHIGRDAYVQRTYLPSSLVQSIAVPVASVTPKPINTINIISPHIAALITQNPAHLESEKQAIASIDKDVKSVGSIIKDVLQGDTTVAVKVKGVIKAIAEGDYSSVEQRMLERDKMQQDLNAQRGERLESSQASIALSSFSTVAKNVVRDAVHAVKSVAATIGDAHLMGNADPKLHEPAADRMKQRTDTISAAVKEVASNPSIITGSIAARAKSNMEKYSKATESGQLWDAGKEVGEELYDVYNISSIAIGLGVGAVSTAKFAKKVYQTHDFRTPIVLQFEMGRLNSGIPIDSIKFQKPMTKKAAAPETGYL